MRVFLRSAEFISGAAVGIALLTWWYLSSSAFLLYFGWPSGAIWGNLIASVLCVGFALWKLRARMIAQHAAAMRQHHILMAQAERQHRARAAQAEAHQQELVSMHIRHHRQLMRHVTDTARTEAA